MDIDEPVLPSGAFPWAAGGSDIGSSRADNEDALLCDCDRGLFAVCDGMGGHAAGEQASAAAVCALDAMLTADRLQDAIADGEKAVWMLLCEALVAANTAILQVAECHREWAGLGTTVVLAFIDDDRLYLANVGDSRAYLIRGKKIDALTSDHTVAATLLAEGEITEEELRDHPLRNRLTMVLGTQDALEPSLTFLTLRLGDRLILCTDGLWDLLEDTDIADIVRYSATPNEAVYALIAAADDAGGHDNITTVVIFR
ncbi:MAG: PP2C family protein-serine/threonine phosphatase [Armatimonadota bacterium]